MPESFKRAIMVQATIDFASIAANVDDENTVVVNGVFNNGTEVVAVSAPALEVGLVVSGFVSDVNEVTVRVSNVTIGAIDAADQAFNIAVIH
jgi:hypothetical protein